MSFGLSRYMRRGQMAEGGGGRRAEEGSGERVAV